MSQTVTHTHKLIVTNRNNGRRATTQHGNQYIIEALCITWTQNLIGTNQQERRRIQYRIQRYNLQKV